MYFELFEISKGTNYEIKADIFEFLNLNFSRENFWILVPSAGCWVWDKADILQRLSCNHSWQSDEEQTSFVSYSSIFSSVRFGLSSISCCKLTDENSIFPSLLAVLLKMVLVMRMDYARIAPRYFSFLNFEEMLWVNFLSACFYRMNISLLIIVVSY